MVNHSPEVKPKARCKIRKHNNYPLAGAIILAHKVRGGGDSSRKVGTDVWRVQNLGGVKFFPKNVMPRQKSAQKPNDRASFYDF